MRRLAIAGTAAAALMLGSTGAHAITFGEPDGDDHPYVVTLIFSQDGGFYSCSGTLLDEDTVLTAGHCTEGGGEVNGVTYVTNDPTPLTDYVSGSGLEAYLAASDDWVQGEAIPHPDYDDYAAFPDTYDIGIVELEEGIDTGGVYASSACWTRC